MTVLLALWGCHPRTAPAVAHAPTCGDQVCPATFRCERDPQPACVVGPEAVGTDPCPFSRCPAETTCQATDATTDDHGVARLLLLPFCEPTVPDPDPLPTRNPCAQRQCPEGYACVAPSDAPYCAPAWLR